jgi:hypothetical protein
MNAYLRWEHIRSRNNKYLAGPPMDDPIRPGLQAIAIEKERP